MASEVEIVNAALTLLGEARIVSMDDDVKPAREAKAMLSITRRALLGGYNWSFAIKRQQLPALAEVPTFGYSYKYNMPTGCLRLVQIGDHFVGVDMVDYRGASSEEYAIEGREILTDLGAPLNVRWIGDVTNTGLFIPNFTKAYAAQLAVDLCEPLTQSDTKRVRAEGAFKHEISLAIRANAIELPPKQLADDSWLLSRL